MTKWRNLGGPHVTGSGKHVTKGQTFEDVDDLDRRFPGKFEKADLTRVARGEPVAPAEQPEADPDAEPTGDAPDVSEYHTGGNWYDIPGVGKVQGKANAETALAEASAASSDG